MSNIGVIVDTTAAIAASIEGVVAVFGSGQGVVTDPLRPSATIRACPNSPSQEFESWSEVASLSDSEWLHQDKGQHLTWVVPIRLWFMRADLGSMRAKAQPFFDRFWTAFASNPTLDGTCGVSRITRMSIGDDPPRGANQARWAFLDVELELEEWVSPDEEPS